jgi:hypothetical protein
MEAVRARATRRWKSPTGAPGVSGAKEAASEREEAPPRGGGGGGGGGDAGGGEALVSGHMGLSSAMVQAEAEGAKARRVMRRVPRHKRCPRAAARRAQCLKAASDERRAALLSELQSLLEVGSRA